MGMRFLFLIPFLLVLWAVPPEVPAGAQKDSSSSSSPASAGNEVWTLLENGQFEQAQHFFQGQIPVDSMDENGRTPLHIAAATRNSELTAFLIARGAAMDLLDRENHTPLSEAV